MASFAEAVNEALGADSEGAAEPSEEGTAPEATETESPEASTEVVEDTAPETEAEKYTFIANGIEHTATLDELRQLASAGQDYTRKTQELAAERQRLAEAEALYEKLSEDPETIVKKLAEAYGLDLADQEPVDAEEARIRKLEQAVQADHQAREQEAAMRRIDTSLSQLHQTYGEFEDEALLAHAIENEIPDLATAYRSMKFEEVRQQAIAAQAEEREQATAARTDAKRDAAVVASGSTTQEGTVSDALPDHPTVKEALQHAIRAAKVR